MINLNEELEGSLQQLKGVGKKRIYAYSKLGINTLFDLLCHFPKSYEDCSRLFFVDEILDGQKCCIKLKIIKKVNLFRNNRLKVFNIHTIDGKGNRLTLVLFNNEFLFNRLVTSKVYIFWGKVEKKNMQVTMTAPRVITEKDMGYIPKYGLTAGLNSFDIIKHMGQILARHNILENLPTGLLKKLGLVNRHKAFMDIHFPKDINSLKQARKRLVFEELFFWQLSLRLIKNKQNSKAMVKLSETNLDEFLATLPFKLTSYQNEVIKECILDCSQENAMNRLVQGDVGCGKTVVAQALCFLFVKSGYQVAVMVPTEILAQQHFNSFNKIFSKLDIKSDLLVGSLKKSERKKILENLQLGRTQIIIGTHSLFSDDVAFSNLGLVITDEQHRFGVLQRRKLACKGKSPHILVMSATPVPRTLALVVFADIDVSIIKKGPATKAAIKTVYIPSTKRSRAFRYIESEILKGHQAYIVCPLIEEGRKNAVAILRYFEELQQCEELKDVRLAMLHGKLTADQKNELMEKFIKKEIDVLVATSVVEVGIDNANASVIVIENAELFGLASLHQLRGRVGRGNIDSLCILISDSKSLNSRQRMEAMCSTCDGFKIAQYDLKLRGPGHFFGTLQHGLPNFKIANLINNFDVVQLSARLSQQLLDADNNLEKHSNLLDMVRKYIQNDSLIL